MRRRRLLAFLVDWFLMLAWIAVLLAVGVPLHQGGVVLGSGWMAQNLLGLSSILPVVLAAAAFESGPRAATPGKRVVGLRVESAGRRASFGRALARNTLKIGLPWLIGHAAVFTLIGAGPADPPAWVPWLLGAAYVLPAAWLASLLTPSARTAYDRLSNTDVRAAEPAA